MSGAIARRWQAQIMRADLDDWLDVFRGRVLPGMRAIEGWLGILVHYSQDGDPCQLTVTTQWKDITALRKFSGDNMIQAVVPDFMEHFFVEYDPVATLHSEFYEQAAL